MSNETPRESHFREFFALCEETEARARQGREDAYRELALVLEAAVAIFALLTFAAVAWCLA